MFYRITISRKLSPFIPLKKGKKYYYNEPNFTHLIQTLSPKVSLKAKWEKSHSSYYYNDSNFGGWTPSDFTQALRQGKITLNFP